MMETFNKDLGICEKCKKQCVDCVCIYEPEFNQMGDSVYARRELTHMETLDGPIMMTMEQYVMVCRYSKTTIGVMTMRQVMHNLKCGKGMEEKP